MPNSEERELCAKLLPMTAEPAAAEATTPAPPDAAPPVAPRRPEEISAHGDTRVDDWYWLRHREDPDVLELLAAENAHTASSLGHLEPLIDDLYAGV